MRKVPMEGIRKTPCKPRSSAAITATFFSTVARTGAESRGGFDRVEPAITVSATRAARRRAYGAAAADAIGG